MAAFVEIAEVLGLLAGTAGVGFGRHLPGCWRWPSGSGYTRGRWRRPPSRRCWRRDSGRGRTTTSQRRTPSGTISPSWASCSRTGVRAPAGFGDRVEGLHATAAALSTGRLIRLIAERGRADREPVAGLVAQARRARDPGGSGRRCPSRGGDRGPQGVVGVGSPIPYRSLGDLVARASPIALLVLDHIEDPHNLGAAARSALAAGIDGLVIPLRRAAHPARRRSRRRPGPWNRSPWRRWTRWPKVGALRRLGVWTLGLDADAESSLFGLELLTEPVAVVVGGEGKGLGRLVAERCDMVASIPIDPRVESLNASVAAALACFEIRRARSIGPLTTSPGRYDGVAPG